MRIIFNIICIIFFYSICYSQCENWNYEKHRIKLIIKADALKKGDRDSIKIKDMALEKTFKKHRVINIMASFPYSKNERLRSFYTMEFQGDLKELEKDLKTNHKNKIGEIIKMPIKDTVKLYEPSDHMWGLQHPDGTFWLWPLYHMQAEEAWDITRGSWNTRIAILDTWFDINHPDLASKLNPLHDPFDLTSFTTDCTQENHGTTVACNAAGHTDGGGQLASIGFNCRIVPYQAWDGDYIERAHHASFAMNADVITSSAGGWTCTGFDSDEQIAVKEILDNGTIIVMPAGNGDFGPHCFDPALGRDIPYRPLTPLYDERVIIVTSTNSDDNHQHVRNNGTTITASHYPEVDICAPSYDIMRAECTEWDSSGICLPNTWPYHGSDASGTSQAAPVVAGICGLMKTVRPSMTPGEAQDILRLTADPVNDASQFPGLIGAGRVNAYCAVYTANSELNLSGYLYGNHTGYYANLNNAIINSGTVNINSAVVSITGTFNANIGATLKIEHPGDFSCP